MLKIDNKTKSILSVPVLEKKSDGTYPKGLTEVQKPRLVVFKPGVNDVEDSDWEIIKKDPSIQRKLERDFLKVVSSVTENKSGSDLKSANKQVEQNLKDGASDALSGFNAREAVDVIKRTFDLSKLEAYSKTEKRATVISAIESQIKAIEEQSGSDEVEE